MGCGSSVSMPPEVPQGKASERGPKPTSRQGSSTSDSRGQADPSLRSQSSAVGPHLTSPQPPSSQHPPSAASGSPTPSPPSGQSLPRPSRPASASASARGTPARATSKDDSQSEAHVRAQQLTSILSQLRREQQQRLGAVEEEDRKRRRLMLAGSSGSGLGDEVEALLGGGGVGGVADRFPDLLRELLAAPTQVLLPGDVNPEDAAALQAVSGCSTDEAVRLLDCLAVIRAAAEALTNSAAAGDVVAKESTTAAAASAAGTTCGTGGEGGGSSVKDSGTAAAGAAAATEGGGGDAAAVMSPSPHQLTRQLGVLAGLVSDYPGLRTAAMARGAPDPLLTILLRHSERAAAANAALVLAALAAGPPPHKTSLINSGVVQGLLTAMRGGTAAAAANGGDAPGVTANACSVLGNLVTGHAVGAAAVAAGGGIETLLGLVGITNAANVRTNAAGVIVQLTGAHESYRAAVVAAGGVAALAAGMLRGPEAPACNAVTALYNLAAMTPPSLRPAMAHVEGPLSVVPQLLLCISGRNLLGATDESVAAASAARVNASAVLLELCKDPASAPLLADPALGVPAALGALAAGRLPPPPPPAGGGDGATDVDILAGGVELLYPVPPVVRGNSLLGLMALARMGPGMQLELGRCGALGTLLELIAPGQDPAMQVNSANAICSLAAANADIHAALVAARCVPLLAGLLLEGGDAARANVCAVFVTMMRDEKARLQLQECGGLSALVRMTSAILDDRMATGVSRSLDPGGVLCNAVGALAEAAKYPDLRRAILQVEFGESLTTLLRCLEEAPEPAQVNAAAALCHLCKEQAVAVQLGRLRGVEKLREIVGSDARDAELLAAVPGGPSTRLLHNASRALARLEDQLADAEAAAKSAADARAAARTAAGCDSGDGAALDADACADGPRGGSSSRSSSARAKEPRGVWGASGGGGSNSASRLALGSSTSGRSASKKVAKELSYGDDEVDDVSTVITPPMPLQAF